MIRTGTGSFTRKHSQSREKILRLIKVSRLHASWSSSGDVKLDWRQIMTSENMSLLFLYKELHCRFLYQPQKCPVDERETWSKYWHKKVRLHWEYPKTMNIFGLSVLLFYFKLSDGNGFWSTRFFFIRKKFIRKYI